MVVVLTEWNMGGMRPSVSKECALRKEECQEMLARFLISLCEAMCYPHLPGFLLNKLILLHPNGSVPRNLV